jgi:anti-sigma-K factor RskA
MNLKEYLSSGIIEDYCLGVLNPNDMQNVARNAERYQEVKDTIEMYESVLKKCAEDLDVDNEMGMNKEEILLKLLKRMRK